MDFLAKMQENGTKNIFTDKQWGTKVPLMFSNVKVLPEN